MNWQTFQEQIYTLTENEIKEINKNIVSIYKQSLTEITDLLAKQYARYLSSIGTDNYYNEMIKYDRLKNLLAETKASYTTYSLKAQGMIEHALSISASNTYYRSMYAQMWLSDAAFKAIPYDLVELIVYGTTDAWKKIPKNLQETYGDLINYQSKAGTLSEYILQNRAREIADIQNAIVTGLQQGKSYQQMADSVASVIGGVTGSGAELTATGAMANAFRIVQTESTRAMNAASYASTQYLSSLGVDVKKRWVATLDSRTRSKHASLDGKTVSVDEPFPGGAMFPGDFPNVSDNIRCRCSTIDIIDGEDPQIRTGRNPQTGGLTTFSYEGFSEWAKSNGLTKNKYGELYVK